MAEPVPTFPCMRTPGNHRYANCALKMRCDPCVLDRPGPVPTTKFCAQCGGGFERTYQSRGQWLEQAYCSNACMGAARSVEIPTKPCERCGQIFERPATMSAKKWAVRRFCTRGCSAIVAGSVTRATHAAKQDAAYKQEVADLQARLDRAKARLAS